MKNFYLFICAFCLTLIAHSQTVIFEEDFESYDDFEYENVGDWTLVDADGFRDQTGFAMVTFPNQNEMTSYIVFNPNETTPPMENFNAQFNWDFSARSGEKYMLAKYLMSGANDDWLISPQIEIPNGEGIQLSFWVKAPSGSIFSEKFNVLVSTSDKELESFTLIDSQTLSEGKAWINMEYPLDDFQGESIYIAIQYVSQGLFGFLVDDFKITAETLGIGNYKKSEIAIFPNPTNETFSLKLPADFQNEATQLQILDISGRKIKSLDLSAPDISELSKGVYFLEITNRNRVERIKLIKN